MSSTETRQGYDDSHRSSSKVMAPPGGRSSINLFGGYEETPAPAQKPAPETTKNNVYGIPPADQAPASSPAKAQSQSTHDSIFGGDGGQTQASKNVQKSYNPLTHTTTSHENNATRPSTKVHAPPGGKSQISFG